MDEDDKEYIFRWGLPLNELYAVALNFYKGIFIYNLCNDIVIFSNLRGKHLWVIIILKEKLY